MKECTRIFQLISGYFLEREYSDKYVLEDKQNKLKIYKTSYLNIQRQYRDLITYLEVQREEIK